MCMNIQSLRLHPVEVAIELRNYEKKPAIIVLTETKLTENAFEED